MLSKRNRIGFIFTSLGMLCHLLLAACTVEEKHSLDIPEGLASATLKEFARQTEIEILFDLQIVYGVKTNAIKGEYERDNALRIMLKDTPLDANYEKESGAYAVFRKRT